MQEHSVNQAFWLLRQMTNLRFATSFEAGDAEDVGGVFSFLQMLTTGIPVFVALVLQVFCYRSIVVGNTDGVLIEIRFGIGGLLER